MSPGPVAGAVLARGSTWSTRQGTWLPGLRQRHARAGLALTVTMVLVALLGSLLAPHSQAALIGAPYAPMSSSAWLGTDYLGHDVLSRILSGGLSVVWMSFGATAFGTVIGITLGLVTGHRRGWLDEAIMRTLDLLMAFPSIVLILLFVSLAGSIPWLVTLLVGGFFVPGIARVTRGLTLECLSREYIEASELLGTPAWRILAAEVLPNLTTPLAVEISVRLTRAIMILAALSFLGFGVQEPNADWGLMINENLDGLQVQPWAVVAPALCIVLLTLGTSLLSEGLARTMAGIDRQGGRQ